MIALVQRGLELIDVFLRNRGDFRVDAGDGVLCCLGGCLVGFGLDAQLRHLNIGGVIGVLMLVLFRRVGDQTELGRGQRNGADGHNGKYQNRHKSKLLFHGTFSFFHLVQHALRQPGIFLDARRFPIRGALNFLPEFLIRHRFPSSNCFRSLFLASVRRRETVDRDVLRMAAISVRDICCQKCSRMTSLYLAGSA